MREELRALNKNFVQYKKLMNTLEDECFKKVQYQ